MPARAEILPLVVRNTPLVEINCEGMALPLYASC
jgi:hypothetical protein